MSEDHEELSIWAQYNAAQTERAVRPLCHEVLGLAGPGGGRMAVDLGCGLGRESDALLRAGWRVHATDWEPGTLDNLVATTRAEDQARLTVQTIGFADLTELPETDLVYAGYSVPYVAPEVFAGLWSVVRSSLRPGGWLALNLLGDRDSYAVEHTGEFTFLTPEAARSLFDGWDS
jgi:trans-aconitate methyltransferase